MSASLSTHVLDTADRTARRGCPGRAVARRRARGLGRDGRRRADRRACVGLDAGCRRARVPSAVGVLPPGDPRDRARGRPPPRAAPRLAVRMRELPGQLTADELAELFEGRTRFVGAARGRARPAHPCAHARARAVGGREARGPGRAPGDRPAGGAVGHDRRAEQGADADPAVLAELARLNTEYEARHGFRFVVFVNRRPKAEILEVLRSADRPPDRRRARRPRSTSSSPSPKTAGDAGERRVAPARDRPVPARLARPAAALAARDRRDRLDRHVLLLRPARPVAPRAEEARGRGRRRAGRAVGGARRRLLQGAEVPRRPAGAARPPRLVQVGGVRDLAVRLRADGRPLLPGGERHPDRPAGGRPRAVAGGGDQRRPARRGLGRLRRALPRARRARARRSAPRSWRSPRSRPGARASCSRRGRPGCRWGRCSAP